MKKVYFLLSLFGFLTFVSCDGKKTDSEEAGVDSDTTVVEIPDIIVYEGDTIYQKKDSLVIYTPRYSKVDLACGIMPSVDDENVVFCAEAAFTGDFLDKFEHSNVAGDHVCNGVRYKGYYCKRNTGSFVYYNNTYKFVYKNYSHELDLAAQNGGAGFCQEMMIHKGERVKTTRPDSNGNEFRALCKLNGRLCVIDSDGYCLFGNFIKCLLAEGVTEALYLDMGPGWNYSWWRDGNGRVHEIHEDKISYTTNWITFYK